MTGATGDIQIVSVQLTIHGNSHPPWQVVGGWEPSYNTKKTDWPEVKQNMTKSKWIKFLYFWGAYKKDTKIEGKGDAIRRKSGCYQQCCMASIRSRIFQVKRKGLLTISEDNLLAAIKTASVNKQSKTSHRNQYRGPTESRRISSKLFS